MSSGEKDKNDMMRFGWVGVWMFVVLFAAAPQLQAETRRMLHGLDAVRINVGQLHPDIEESGMSRTALLEELTRNLRQAGLQVTRDDGRSSTADRPELDLTVHVAPVENFPLYSVFITMKLQQTACLTRNLIVCEPVVTWEDASAMRTVSVSQLPDVQQDVHALISRFVDAYLAENAKR
jgi:hypothetical protein